MQRLVGRKYTQDSRVVTSSCYMLRTPFPVHRTFVLVKLLLGQHLRDLIKIVITTDFDEIMESCGVARDQLIRPIGYILVTIRITIRIRKSVPVHDPDPGRTATIIMLAYGGGLCSLSTSSYVWQDRPSKSRPIGGNAHQ